MNRLNNVRQVSNSNHGLQHAADGWTFSNNPD